MTHAPTQSQAREMLKQCPFCGTAMYAHYDTALGMFGPEGEHKPACIFLNYDMHEWSDAELLRDHWNARALTPASDDATVERVAEAGVPMNIEFGIAYLDGALEDEPLELRRHWQRVRDYIAILAALAALPPRTSDDVAKLRTLREAVRTIIGLCEAIEDKAADELAKELTEHATGYRRGEKATAKMLRRYIHDMTRAALADGEKSNG